MDGRPLRLPTLDRYLAVNVAQNFLFALATLVVVFSVINATEELQRVGAGSYGVRQALWFVLPDVAERGLWIVSGRGAARHRDRIWAGSRTATS